MISQLKCYTSRLSLLVPHSCSLSTFLPSFFSANLFEILLGFKPLPLSPSLHLTHTLIWSLGCNKV